MEIPDGATRCPKCQADLRNWFARHKILSFFLGLFLLAIIFSAIGDKKTDTKIITDKNGDKIEVKKEYKKIISLNTSSQKNSDSFKLEGGKQKLVYSFDKKQFSSCIIYLLDEGTDLMTDGGFPIVMADGKEGNSGETILRKSAGEYYLSIKSANTNCTVDLYEMK